MKNRGGQPGRHRSDARRFPYEPRIVGGKVMMPADLQRIHSSVLNGTMTGMISEETRAVVESLWPELLDKLPPAAAYESAVFPTLEEQAAAKEIITKQWDTVVGANVQ